VAAAGLAEDGQPSADEPLESRVRLSLTGGLDYATAFFFRGYQRGDNGLILQPYLTLFADCPLGGGAVVRPYVSLFNSSELGGHDEMSDMTDVMVGTALTWHGLLVDGKYTYYSPAPAPHLPMHELGVRVSYDVLSLCAKPEGSAPFALRLFTGVYGELSEGKGALYVEPGLEPSWRFELAGRKIGLGLPVLCGLGAGGYYLNDRGENAPVGYLSSAVTASVSLPFPVGCGEWFLNASIPYLYLFADNLVLQNNGSHDAFVAKVGIGFLF
jgi:hypothetical protein